MHDAFLPQSTCRIVQQQLGEIAMLKEVLERNAQHANDELERNHTRDRQEAAHPVEQAGLLSLALASSEAIDMCWSV
jgi:hypothetical protein